MLRQKFTVNLYYSGILNFLLFVQEQSFLKNERQGRLKAEVSFGILNFLLFIQEQ